MVKAGGIYLFASSPHDRPQWVRVRRISTDGHWADVVGEMGGVWMRHGWRALVSHLSEATRPGVSRT